MKIRVLPAPALHMVRVVVKTAAAVLGLHVLQVSLAMWIGYFIS